MPFREEASDRRGPSAPLQVEMGEESPSQFYADISGVVIGVFASTFLVFERDAHVELVISFPDWPSISTKGLVQFVREAGPDQLPGLGIQFTELSPADREIVEGFSARITRPPMLFDE